MNIGTFDRKVTIVAYREIENEVGAAEQQLTELYRTWARIEPIRGREYYEAAKQKEAELFKITVRFRKNLTADMIIRYQGKDYQIQHIADPYMAHEILELHCIIRTRGAAENV